MKRIVTFLLLVVTTITFAQESIYLRVNYKAGDKYNMKMTMDQNIGEGMVKMNMFMQMLIDVKSVNDKVYDSEISFQRVTMNMNQGGIEVSYDSDEKEEDMDPSAKQMHLQMKPMLETVLSSKTNDLGKLIEMKVIEGSGDVSQFTNQAQSVTYPEEKISVGYTWKDEKNNNGMDIKSSYTVRSIDKNIVILDVDGTISGMAEGTLNGDMQIDRSTGNPTESNLQMDMTVMGQKAISTVKISMKKE